MAAEALNIFAANLVALSRRGLMKSEEALRPWAGRRAQDLGLFFNGPEPRGLGWAEGQGSWT